MALIKGKTVHYEILKYRACQIFLEAYLREIKKNPISQKIYSPDELIDLEIYGELLEKVGDVLKKLFYDFDSYSTLNEVQEDMYYVQRNQGNINTFLKKGLAGIKRDMTLLQKIKFSCQKVRATLNILIKGAIEDPKDINQGT